MPPLVLLLQSNVRQNRNVVFSAKGDDKGHSDWLDVRQRHGQVPRAVSQETLGFGVFLGLGLAEELT